MRFKPLNLVKAVISTTNSNLSEAPQFIKIANECPTISNNLQNRVNVFVWGLQVQIPKKRKNGNNSVSVKILAIVGTLIDIAAAIEVMPRTKTKLQSLAPFFKGGNWVTQGRMKHGLLAILGIAQSRSLPSN